MDGIWPHQFELTEILCGALQNYELNSGWVELLEIVEEARDATKLTDPGLY